MAWPLPQPDEISDRLAAGYEAEFATHPDVPPEGIDARSATSPLAIASRVQAGEAHGLYQHQAHIAQELFADTSRDELPRHGDLWGVGRRPAGHAAGDVTFAGVDGTVIPAVVSAMLGEVAITTSAGGVISGGTLTVPAQAAVAGAPGNLPPGAVLSLVGPIAGLSSQSVTVAAPGFGGGVDQEEMEAWRSRILTRIRSGVFYGQDSGYEGVALAVPGVAVAREIPRYLGLGTVGVIVAMGTRLTPRAPTPAELDIVQAALDAARPVTAMVFAVAAVIEPVPLSLHLMPDTAAVRGAVADAFGLFLASEPGIGGTIHRSRLSEAISSAAGEYAHRVDVPAADIALAVTHLAVPGAITWLPA